MEFAWILPGTVVFRVVRGNRIASKFEVYVGNLRKFLILRSSMSVALETESINKLFLINLKIDEGQITVVLENVVHCSS